MLELRDGHAELTGGELQRAMGSLEMTLVDKESEQSC